MSHFPFSLLSHLHLNLTLSLSKQLPSLFLLLLFPAPLLLSVWPTSRLSFFSLLFPVFQSYLISQRMSLVFFSKLGVFPNNVSCRFLYTLLLCCRNSRKWGCWYQRNDHILSLTFVSYDVLFSKIILNVCGVYICLTREKMCGATCCGDPMFMFLQSWMEDVPLKLRQAVCASFFL